MTRNDIIKLTREAGIPEGNIQLLAWGVSGNGMQMIERLIEIAAAAERRKHQADIERWKTEAATAEKWRGLALSKDGDGRCVERIQQEAAAKEREACAKAIDAMKHGNVRTCAAAIRARGQQ